MRVNSIKERFLLGVVVFCTLLAVSCTRFVAEKRVVDAIGAGDLKAYADEIRQDKVWKELRGQPAPKEIWHPAFATNGVLRVKPYLSGVLLVLETQGKMERGVYILAKDAETPENGSGITLARMQSRIYWFEQKVRDVYIPREQRNPESQ